MAVSGLEQPRQLVVSQLAALTRQQAHRAVHAPAFDQAPDLSGREIEPFRRAPLRQQTFGRGLNDLEAVSLAQTHGDPSSIGHGGAPVLTQALPV